MHRSCPARLDKSCIQLLTVLASGRRLATRIAPDDAMRLIAEDLACRHSDGRLDITSAGRAFLSRAALARQDVVDPFLGQQLALVAQTLDGPDGRARLLMDESESPLSWLARRKGKDGHALIAPHQLLAGERLRSDFTRAQIMPRTTSNWDRSLPRERRTGAPVMTGTESAVTARQCLHRALDAAGPEFSGLLLDVCCFLKGLEEVERERAWPRSSAKVVLQLGLERLARHYGYGAEAVGAAWAKMRAWNAAEGESAGDSPAG